MNWSFSTLKDYEECPHRLYLKHTGSAKRRVNAASAGIVKHKAIEDFIKGTATLLPTPYFKPEIEALRDKFSHRKAYSELKLGLTPDWRPAPWSAATGRAILDALIDETPHISVYDFKSGTSHIGHEDQANIYTPFVLAHFPLMETVSVEFLHINDGSRARYDYTRDNITTFRTQRLQERVNNLASEFMFAPRPTKQRCAHCQYLNACEYAPDEAFDLAAEIERRD